MPHPMDIMLSKLLFCALIILPVGAANNDDEIIRNLDFFQSMEILKEDVAFVSNNQTIDKIDVKKEETKQKAPEKK